MLAAPLAGCGPKGDGDTPIDEETGDPITDDEATDRDGDGHTGAEDCDDSDALIYVSAAEVCDGLDNDCDGATDDADSDLDVSGVELSYADADADGFGDPALFVRLCTPPTGYVADSTDCDDAAGDVNPAAAETCNELDDDCDTLVDAQDPDIDPAELLVSWPDTDGDGHGDATADAWLDCSVGAGAALNADDCDDADARAYPGATEVCDGIDDDCDGTADSSAVCPCDVEYYTDTTHPYMFCTPGVDWETARSTCASYGYHLITMDTEDENTWAHDAALPHNIYYWWIGLNDLTTEGVWEWIDGSAVSFTEWDSGEPSNSGGNEDCVHFIANQSTAWNDLNCATSQNYLCEAG